MKEKKQVKLRCRGCGFGKLVPKKEYPECNITDFYYCDDCGLMYERSVVEK